MVQKARHSAHSKARVFRKHKSTFERTSIQKTRKHIRKHEYHGGEEGKERGKELLLGRWPGGINCDNKRGTPNITMHYFPSDEKLRAKWTRFVRIHRKDFVPKKSSCWFSAHFDESCFINGVKRKEDRRATPTRVFFAMFSYSFAITIMSFRERPLLYERCSL